MNIKKTTLKKMNDPEDPVLFRVIKNAGRDKLRQKLDKIGKNYFKLSKETGKRQFSFKDLQVKIEELFSNYFSPYENLITVRSDKPKDKLLQEAMSYYSVKNYNDAAKLLKKHLTENPDDNLISLYLGISFLVLGSHKKAAVIFRKILKSGNPVIADHARWYLALSNLKESNISEALNELSNIGKKSIYYRKAGNLIRKISDLK